jgi:hypothetical protein
MELSNSASNNVLVAASAAGCGSGFRAACAPNTSPSSATASFRFMKTVLCYMATWMFLWTRNSRLRSLIGICRVFGPMFWKHLTRSLMYRLTTQELVAGMRFMLGLYNL